MTAHRVLAAVLLAVAALCGPAIAANVQPMQQMRLTSDARSQATEAIASDGLAGAGTVALEEVGDGVSEVPSLRQLLHRRRGYYKRRRCYHKNCRRRYYYKRRPYYYKKRGGGGKEGKEGTGGKKGDDGEVVCVTKTVKKEVVKQNNAAVHANAVASALEKVCEMGNSLTLKDIDDVFMAQDAKAFAKTVAAAMVACRSTDEDAYKCVSVTASAKAYAEATATAMASAVANAVKSCGCLTEAVASAMTDSALNLRLTAEAASTATAEVCVKGEGYVKDTAYDSCTSQVYGKIYAKAVAEAITKGNCLDSAAEAEVMTDAGADISAESTCGMTADAMEFFP